MARKSRLPKPDKRGRITVRIGSRDDRKAFTFPRTVSPKDVDDRAARIKNIYEVCGAWNELALDIANHVFKGAVPVPLPAYKLISYWGLEHIGWVGWREQLVKRLPSIPWAQLGESKNINPGVLGGIRQYAINEIERNVSIIGSLDVRSYEVDRLIPGTLHEALTAYMEYVTNLQPNNTFRRTKIRQLLQRHPDQPLATLNLDACREMFDYWRTCALRQPNKNIKEKPKRIKKSDEFLAELIRFLSWLHTNEKFQWEEPKNFDRLERKIEMGDDEDDISIEGREIKLFTLDDLSRLVRFADFPEKLWIVWCLNNSHGAAEVGRVKWGDLRLGVDHPSRHVMPDLPKGGDWVGLLRPKSKVLGWWRLWPETVSLLQRWKVRCETILGRPPEVTDRILIRKSGMPLYNDKAQNSQAEFAKRFTELKLKCERMGQKVSPLPAGTLRSQFADWCGNQGYETLAKMALAHGKPFKEDKLLFEHYANKPWAKLFEKQMEFREVCRPVLDAIDQEPMSKPDYAKFHTVWAQLQSSGFQKIKDAATALDRRKGEIMQFMKDENLRL